MATDPVNRSGNPYSAPRDGNRVPIMLGVSTADGVTALPLEVDPNTGQLQTSGSGGGGGSDVQYTDGNIAPAHPIGTIPVFNNAGTITAVSVANPLPVTAAVTITGVATSANQTNASQKTQLVDGSGNVITSTSNALNVSLTNASVAVTGTFFQATQPVSGTVTANAGTNLNTSLLALESGGNLATVATNTTNIPNVIGTAANAIPSKLIQVGGSDGTNARALKTNTTGQLDIRPLTSSDQVTFANSSLAVTQSTSPWIVAGGGTAGTAASGVVTVQGITSMTPVQVSQATAASLNATVVGTGTFATQATQAGTWNITNISGTVSLPTGAATSANQTNATQKTQIVDGSGNIIASTSNALNVAITSGGGSGGTSSSFGSSFPATGTAIGAKNGLNMVNLAADASSNLLVSLATALPAGSAAIGSITNTSFAVTQGTAANLNATVVGTGTFIVQATLAAETTKVIGVVRTADGTGNLLTSTADALDINIKSGSIANTTFGATQATAANLNATVVGTGTFVVQNNAAIPTGTNTIGSVKITDGTNTATVLATLNALKTDYSSVAGTATSVNNGTTDAGTQRVTISSDSTGQVKLAAGANAVGSISNTGFISTQTDTFATTTAFVITAASLANSTAGVGRQSTLITSNTARSAMINCKITTGTTPTANTLIYVYLIRGDGTINDDNAGASDAALTVINAPLLGTILVPATTSNTAYYGVFDTKPFGSLGKTFGVAIVNSTGAALNSTAGNHVIEYTTIT